MTERVIDALLNATWQTMLVAVLVAAALRVLPRSSASVRCAIWSAALCIGIALPVLDFFGAHSVMEPKSVSTSHVSAGTSIVHAPLRIAATQSRIVLVQSATGSSTASQGAPWLVVLALAVHRAAQIGIGVWILGMVFCGARFAYQITCLVLAKNAIEPLESLTFAHNIRARRSVRIGVSDRVAVPCLLGLVRPVIALPRALADELSDADLQRVVLHESAHLQRCDDWFNLVEQIALVLLFFNPAMHYIARCIGMEREIACDDHVVAQSQNRLTYAECLTALARRCTVRRALMVPGFFTNRRQILVRIEQLLDHGHDGSRKVGPKAFAAIAAVGACALVLAQFGIPVIAAGGICPLTQVRLAPALHTIVAASFGRPVLAPHAASVAPVAHVAPARPAYAPRVVRVHVARPALAPKPVHAVKPSLPKRAPVAASNVSVAVADSTQAVSDAIAISDSSATAVAIVAAPERSQDGSFADGMASSGYANLSVDQLIEMRDHGVTPRYIQELKAAGYAGLLPQELIDLRDHGVNAAFAMAMSGLAKHQLGVQALIEMRDHGVSASYATALIASGLRDVAFEQLIDLRDHGVSASYLTELARAGYSGLSAQEAIELRDHGVTLRYIEHVRKDLNDRRLPIEELIRLRDSGI